MGLLSGLLNAARVGTPLVAAARAGYATGQDEQATRARSERRQTLLDRMKANVDTASIDRDQAATKLALAQADRANRQDIQPEEWDNVSGADTPTIFEKHSGRSRAVGSPKAKGFRQFDQYNPESGMMEDITDDGKRVPRRKATLIERAKFNHMPRDPNEPAPMNAKAEEDLAGTLADSAVRGVGGDPIKAMEWMESRPTEYAKAKSAGMTRRHYYEAAERFKMEQDRAKRGETGSLSSLMQKYSSDGSAPANAPGTPKPTTSGDVNLGRGATQKPNITQDQYEYLVTPSEQGGRGMTPAEVRAQYIVKG